MPRVNCNPVIMISLPFVINCLLFNIFQLSSVRNFSLTPPHLIGGGISAPEPKNWLKHNDKKFPPQEIGEERRPAFVCHMRTNIRYSYKKFLYLAFLIRGLQIDEAIKQLKFVDEHKLKISSGGATVIEVLEEAREMAIKDHNVECGTNLWVAESFVGKAFVLRGIRRHARGRVGQHRVIYVHYFVRLEEGTPPESYYYFNRPLTPQEKLDNWLNEKRERTIPFSR
ncbi:39S ribosomal protein L22, mitochondrial [Armadillidium vulgare]|nr:39S ribosomal protein L22, mitochondrial [Armadillidium vulgare]